MFLFGFALRSHEKGWFLSGFLTMSEPAIEVNSEPCFSCVLPLYKLRSIPLNIEINSVLSQKLRQPQVLIHWQLTLVGSSAQLLDEDAYEYFRFSVLKAHSWSNSLQLIDSGRKSTKNYYNNSGSNLWFHSQDFKPGTCSYILQDITPSRSSELWSVWLALFVSVLANSTPHCRAKHHVHLKNKQAMLNISGSRANARWCQCSYKLQHHIKTTNLQALLFISQVQLVLRKMTESCMRWQQAIWCI